MDKLKNTLELLSALRNEKNVDGMKGFGITATNALGISTPSLHKIAKEIGKDHQLAVALWKTNIHEARILAAMVADPAQTTPELMDEWTSQFDSWDVCDQCCTKLFRYTPYADQKIYEWANRSEEYVKRAAFALIAACAVGDKKSSDEKFVPYFDLMVEASTDERNFVMKAVNWALRQTGKRSYYLWNKALAAAEEMMLIKSKSARWIGSDATRELTTEKVVRKIMA